MSGKFEVFKRIAKMLDLFFLSSLVGRISNIGWGFYPNNIKFMAVGRSLSIQTPERSKWTFKGQGVNIFCLKIPKFPINTK